MLHQVKPIVGKSDSDTLTVHVGHGAPGVTVPVQVSRPAMEALIASGDWPDSMRKTVAAYWRATRPVGE